MFLTYLLQHFQFTHLTVILLSPKVENTSAWLFQITNNENIIYFIAVNSCCPGDIRQFVIRDSLYLLHCWLSADR